MQIVIILLGIALVCAGLYFAVGGFGQGKSGGGFRDIKMEGPPWLILVAIGVGLVVFGTVGEWGKASPPQTAANASQQSIQQSATQQPVSMASVKTFKVEGRTWTTESKPDVDWAQATAYCEGLNAGGLRYRLPTIAELQSIATPNTADAIGIHINNIFRNGIKSDTIWSSEDAGAGNAYAFNFSKLERRNTAMNFDGGYAALCVAE